MPGFGVAVLAAEPARAAPPAVFEKSPPLRRRFPEGPRADASDERARRERRERRRRAREHRRAGIPSKGRCLRGPVEIDARGRRLLRRVREPRRAAPDRAGVRQEVRWSSPTCARAAAGAPRAPDGLRVGAAAAAARRGRRPDARASVGGPKNGRERGGRARRNRAWPRSAWRRPARRAEGDDALGSRAAAAAAADTTRIDWSAATGQPAAAAAGVAANAAAAMGAADAPDIGAAFAGGGVPGDAAARCVEAHRASPCSSPATRSARVGLEVRRRRGRRDGAFAGAVRPPTARVEARRGDVHLAGRADAAAASARARVRLASPGSAAAGSASGERGHPRVTAGSSRFDDSSVQDHEREHGFRDHERRLCVVGGVGAERRALRGGRLGRRDGGVALGPALWTRARRPRRSAAAGLRKERASRRSGFRVRRGGGRGRLAPRQPRRPKRGIARALGHAPPLARAAGGGGGGARGRRHRAVLAPRLRRRRRRRGLCWPPPGATGDIAAHDPNWRLRGRRADQCAVARAAWTRASATPPPSRRSPSWRTPAGRSAVAVTGIWFRGGAGRRRARVVVRSGAHAQHFAAAHERHT